MIQILTFKMSPILRWISAALIGYFERSDNWCNSIVCSIDPFSKFRQRETTYLTLDFFLRQAKDAMWLVYFLFFEVAELLENINF